MTDRVFEDARSWEVSGEGRGVDVHMFDEGDVLITVVEDTDWDYQNASFTMTAAEATALKEFLIKKGY